MVFRFSRAGGRPAVALELILGPLRYAKGRKLVNRRRELDFLETKAASNAEDVDWRFSALRAHSDGR